MVLNCLLVYVFLSENVQTNAMSYRGISHALYAICRDEGMRGLYKGLGPTLLVKLIG
ncbi:unnamed protein product [Musa banksii]